MTRDGQNSFPRLIANKELGYLNLEDAELAVMTYNFNYLHSYADDKFIGMMEDSVLNVKDGKYAFFMKESKEANYGFTSVFGMGTGGSIALLPPGIFGSLIAVIDYLQQ